jgi:hypothetical protein
LNKITAIFLTTIFALNLLGPIVIFKAQQYEARREAIQQMKKGNSGVGMTQIFIKKEHIKSLLWVRDNEFRYHGKMYDVIKEQQDDKGNIVYYCYDDSLESFLYERLHKHVKDSKKTKKTRNASVKVTFKYLPKRNVYSVVKNCAFLKQRDPSFFNYTFFYNAPTLEISGPPPKLV